MMKKAIKTPVDHRIFKATKDSDGLTKRGLADAHGEKALSKTDFHPETASCKRSTQQPLLRPKSEKVTNCENKLKCPL
jgi:hypothetical protein